MGAAEDFFSIFDSMSDDLASAVGAFRSQCLNRTFKGIEDMRLAVHYDFKRLVVIISASFAGWHKWVGFRIRGSCGNCVYAPAQLR